MMANGERTIEGRYSLTSALDILSSLSREQPTARVDVVRAAISLAIWAPASAHLATGDEMCAVVADLEDLVLSEPQSLSVSARARASALEATIRAGLHPIH
jgi:hypothetical protein